MSDTATKVAELEARVQQRVLETKLKVMDRFVEDSNDWGWGAPIITKDSLTRPYYGPRETNFAAHRATMHDRKDGAFLPFYETEDDLAIMRAQCRNLATFTSIYCGAIEALQNYVLGTDWEHEVVPKDELMPNPMIMDVAQRVIDQFMEDNHFVGGLDREIDQYARTEGEVLVGLYPTAPGRVRAKRIEIDGLREPLNKRQLDQWLDLPQATKWNFGVHVAYDEVLRHFDHERPLGYHVVFNEEGTEWDYLPNWPNANLFQDSRCAMFVKRNVPDSAARGVSDFWPIISDLEGEFKLTRNTRVGAAVQAAIAYIIEHGEGASKSEVESDAVVDALLRYQSKGPDGERTKNVQRANPGHVVDVSQGNKYHAGPLGSLRSPVFIEVAQHILRRIGVRWNMPEYMISGDASNSNFASTLVAESPFVKSREADQAWVKHRRKVMLFKVLKMAFDDGLFEGVAMSWQDVHSQIDLEITAPEVSSRDKLQSAQANKILFDEGILDAETWAVQADLDPEKTAELQMQKQQQALQMQQQMMLPGMEDPALAATGTDQTPPPEFSFEGHDVTPEKAKKILKDGKVNGKALTAKQKKFFGLIAGGGTATKLREHTPGGKEHDQSTHGNRNVPKSFSPATSPERHKEIHSEFEKRFKGKPRSSRSDRINTGLRILAKTIKKEGIDVDASIERLRLLSGVSDFDDEIDRALQQAPGNANKKAVKLSVVIEVADTEMRDATLTTTGGASASMETPGEIKEDIRRMIWAALLPDSIQESIIGYQSLDSVPQDILESWKVGAALRFTNSVRLSERAVRAPVLLAFHSASADGRSISEGDSYRFARRRRTRDGRLRFDLERVIS